MIKKKKINWSEVRYNLLISFLSGIILGFSFPPFQFGIIACLGFIPLFILFENLHGYGKIFKYTYFTFVIFNLISNYWVGGWSNEVDIFLMLSGVVLILIHPFFFTVPFLFLHFIRKNIGDRVAIFSFPFLWIAFEYLHSLGELSYPWLILGNTQTYDIYRIQYIIYTGVYGISFWIVSVNVLLYILYSKIINNIWDVISWESISFTLLIIGFFILPNISSWLIMKDEIHSHKKLKISILQPNIDPWEKWKKSNPFEQVEILLEMTSDADKKYNPDIIIWPETAIPYYLRQSYYLTDYKKIKNLIDSLDLNLISGFADFKFYRPDEEIPKSSKKGKLTGQHYDSFNSILFLQTHYDSLQIYHKMKLVPFSERIPYLDLYPFLINVLEWGVGISNWAIGRDSTIFCMKSIEEKNAQINKFSNPSPKGCLTKFWAMVCFESIYPGFVAAFVNKGAEFLVIVTNDSWFGNSSGPYQHNQFAVLRAIENRRAIARCANGGISSFIDPYGRILEKSKMFVKTTLDNEIEVRNDLTFYTRYGDVFALSLTYLAALLIIISAVNKIRRKIKSR